MEVIQSFTIDHTRLKPGIYVSRIDKGFTTFDLRITEPNKEPAVAPAAMHSMEHLMATWFRNSEVKDDVVYVGPMGCLTGMYCRCASGKAPAISTACNTISTVSTANSRLPSMTDAPLPMRRHMSKCYLQGRVFSELIAEVNEEIYFLSVVAIA